MFQHPTENGAYLIDSGAPIDCKKLNREERTFEGFGSTEKPDRYGDTVLATAFKKTLRARKLNTPVLFNHWHDDIVGHYLELEVRDGEGLWVRGKIDKGYDLADTTWLRLEQGSLQGLSIGFIPTRTRDYPEGEAPDIDWRKPRIIEELDLLECSLVTVPANRFSHTRRFAADSVIRDMKDAVEAFTEVAKSLTEKAGSVGGGPPTARHSAFTADIQGQIQDVMRAELRAILDQLEGEERARVFDALSKRLDNMPCFAAASLTREGKLAR